MKRAKGGYLGDAFVAKSGLPVINVPGSPAHPDWITQIVVAVATGRSGDIGLDEFQRPKTFFQSFTQTGCTRNMHFAYKVSATEFGQRKGCLFYDLGCRRPMTHSPCNRILWNRQSSKTRAGMPCMGCTEPEFPFFDLAPGTVFKTQTVMGVPKELPLGVDRKGMLGLDVLYMANEGELVAVVPRSHAEPAGHVILNTLFGGERVVDMLVGEQLPRIC